MGPFSIKRIKRESKNGEINGVLGDEHTREDKKIGKLSFNELELLGHTYWVSWDTEKNMR